MISEFKYINNQGQALKVDLSGGDNLFIDCSEEELADYYSSDSVGIRWECDGKEVLFHEENEYLTAIPTPSLDKVVVVHPTNEPLGNSNAAIYHCDGTKYIDLVVPDLVSPIYQERKQRMKSDLMATALFHQVFLVKETGEKMVIALGIDFDREYWELRVLNPETGEFGECLKYGRR